MRTGFINRTKLNQKGFTMVELLIGVAILSIVVVAIGSFMVTGTKTYTSENSDITVQEEAQLALNQISDVVIDTVSSVTYAGYPEGSGNGIEALNDSEFDFEPVAKSLTLYNMILVKDPADPDKYVVDVDKNGDRKNYQFYWDKASEALYFSESDPMIDGDNKPVTDFSNQKLLAENVKDFSIDLAQVEKDRIVRVKLDLYNRDKTYTSSDNITVRNKLSVNVLTPPIMDRDKDPQLTVDSMVVLEPGEDYTFSIPKVTGRNVTDKSVTFSFESAGSHDAGTVLTDPAGGKIHISNAEKASEFNVIVTTNEKNKSGNGVSKTITVKIKRANSVDLASNAEGDTVKAGQEVTITGAASGNLLGKQCGGCGDNPTKDKDLVSGWVPTGWTVIAGADKVEVISADNKNAKIKIKDNVKKGDTITIQAVSDLSVRKGYDQAVKGTITFTVAGNGKKTGGGIIKLGNNKVLWNSGFNMVVAVRMNDNAEAAHSTDKVLLTKSSGANLRIDPNQYGIKWTDPHYFYIEVFREPNNFNTGDFTNDYLSHVDSETGLYTGTKYESVYYFEGRTEVPYVRLTYDGVTYDGKSFNLRSAVANTSDAGDNRRFLLDGIAGMYDGDADNDRSALAKYIGLTVYKEVEKNGAKEWVKVATQLEYKNGQIQPLNNGVMKSLLPNGSLDIGGLRLNEAVGREPRIKIERSNSWQEAVGNYKIVPTIVYRTGDYTLHSELGGEPNPIFYKNYQRDTNYYEKEMPESTVYFSVVSPDSKYNVHNLFTDASGSVKEGELYFPTPAKSADFNKYFNFGGNSGSKSTTGTFAFHGTDNNMYAVNFSKITCDYNKATGQYKLQFFYDFTNHTWRRTMNDVPAAVYTWKTGQNDEWTKTTTGKYDPKGPDLGPTLKDVWVYAGIAKTAEFLKADGYFPLPSETAFSDYFKLGVDGLQETQELDDIVFRQKNSWNNDYGNRIEDVLFNKATCRRDSSGAYILELFYNYTDSYFNVAKAVSMGTFRADMNSTEWVRVTPGKWDSELEGGKREFSFANMKNFVVRSQWNDDTKLMEAYYPMPGDKDFPSQFANLTNGGTATIYDVPVKAQIVYNQWSKEQVTATYNRVVAVNRNGVIELKFYYKKTNGWEEVLAGTYTAKEGDEEWVKR